MNHVPRSEQFDDVYFSVQDGLAETRHVFLDGNKLPGSWAEGDHFTICETGFGTGLNFLAVVKLWLDCEKVNRPNVLHFFSFEKHPLDKDYIVKSLAHWGELNDLLADYLAIYPSDLKGDIYNLTLYDDIRLTLIFGDINNEMPKLDAEIDCWFLDGFKPSSNPDMWSETVFKNMARLSNKGASFSTFTAAGFVRRGLSAVGFEVKKVPGYGRKREMCVGSFVGTEPCV